MFVLISLTELLTQFSLSMQLSMHCNVNTINTQSATCFDNSWVQLKETFKLLF